MAKEDAPRPPSMLGPILGAVVAAVALGALVIGLSGGDDDPPRRHAPAPVRADAAAPTPPPAPPPFRLTMSPLPYVGEIDILEEAIADGRAEFEPCWLRAGGRNGTYRVRVRLDSEDETASAGEVEVVPHPGVDPYVCITALLTPRPGHGSFFDGGFTLTVAGPREPMSSAGRD